MSALRITQQGRDVRTRRAIPALPCPSAAEHPASAAADPHGRAVRTYRALPAHRLQSTLRTECWARLQATKQRACYAGPRAASLWQSTCSERVQPDCGNERVLGWAHPGSRRLTASRRGSCHVTRLLSRGSRLPCRAWLRPELGPRPSSRLASHAAGPPCGLHEREGGAIRPAIRREESLQLLRTARRAPASRSRHRKNHEEDG